MKPIKVLVYVLILALAGAGVWYSLYEEEKTQEATEIANKVVALDNPLKAKLIELSGTWYQEPIRIKRLAQEHRWQITSPVNYPAQAVAISVLLNTVIDARLKKRIKEPYKLKDFGLEPPLVKIAITDQKDKQHVLLVGSSTPDNRHLYVTSPEAKEIWLLEAKMRGQLASNLLNYRDKAVLDFVALDVTQVKLGKWPQDLAVKRIKGGEKPLWELTDGTKASAGDVEDLLYQIHGLQTIALLDKGIDLAKMGLDQPRAKVTLSLTKGRETGFIIGGPTGGNQESYVRRISGGPVMVVKDENLKLIQRKPFALVERRLFKFDRDDVTALTVKRGEKELRFAKVEGRWRQVHPQSSDPKAGQNLGLFLWELKELKWEKILSKEQKIPLENPWAVIMVSLTPQSKEAKAADSKRALTLTVGEKDKDTGLLPVMVQGRPELFGVKTDFQKEIPQPRQDSPKSAGKN